MSFRRNVTETISGLELARDLKVSVRSLPKLEQLAKIERVNNRVPPAKRRYSDPEIKKMERVLKRLRKPSGNPVLYMVLFGAFILMAVIYVVLAPKPKLILENPATSAEKPSTRNLYDGIDQLQRGNNEKAREIFEDLKSCGDPDVEKQAHFYYVETMRDTIPLYAQNLKQFISNYPESQHTGDAVYSLATIFKSQNADNESLEYFQMMREKFPDHPLTPNALMELMQNAQEKNNILDVVELAKHLATQYPHSKFAPKALFKAATLLIEPLSQQDKALELLRKLHTTYPSYNSAKVNELILTTGQIVSLKSPANFYSFQTVLVCNCNRKLLIFARSFSCKLINCIPTPGG